MNVYTHIGFDDAEEELKRMEEFRKAQAEVEQKKKEAYVAEDVQGSLIWKIGNALAQARAFFEWKRSENDDIIDKVNESLMEE